MPGVDPKLLRGLSFLKGASPEVSRALAAAATSRRFKAGQVVLEEGTLGRDMYAVVRGKVEVAKGHGAEQVVLAERGPGEFFGEMALFEATPRFASVRALEPTVLLEFSEHELRSVLMGQPSLLYQAILTLIHRLRQTDLGMIADLQRKNEELARAYREL